MTAIPRLRRLLIAQRRRMRGLFALPNIQPTRDFTVSLEAWLQRPSSLTFQVLNLCQKDCPCRKTSGMVKFRGSWVFCDSCFSEQAGAMIWAAISDRYHLGKPVARERWKRAA